MSKSAGNNVKFQDPVSPTIKTASSSSSLWKNGAAQFTEASAEGAALLLLLACHASLPLWQVKSGGADKRGECHGWYQEMQIFSRLRSPAIVVFYTNVIAM
jgi:hypothetical protein